MQITFITERDKGKYKWQINPCHVRAELQQIYGFLKNNGLGITISLER